MTKTKRVHPIGHPVDLMSVMHDPVHEEPGIHNRPRFGGRRMTKTKRVRIALCVDEDGQFSAAPLPANEDPRDMLNSWGGLDVMSGNYVVSIIEADAPMPEEPKTVKGEIVDE
jgi:hypothetical protein